MMNEIRFFAATLIVLFLPGVVWLGVVRPRGMDALERLIEAAGAGLSLTALAAYIFFLAGLRLSAVGFIGVYLAVLALGGWVWLRGGARLRFSSAALLAVGVFLAVAAWRLFQARSLVLPAWVDPVHHVLLVRKIFEYGGLPPDWLPYLPVPMFYHFGFHVISAAFSLWSGLSPAQSVLLFGQVINALVALSVYRLAKAAWGDARRAALALLLTAFAFHMPAYYLSWGRYTLLAGLVVLPLAMAAALEVRRRPADGLAWARLALYSAAVCFCHFLAVGLLILFLALMVAAELWHVWRARSLRGLTWQPYAAAALGALLAAPWLARVWSYTHQMFAVALPNLFDPALAAAEAWQYVLFLTGPRRSHLLLAAAGLALLWGLAHGRARLVALWGLLLAFLATPFAPHFDPFRPDHLAIVLFLPGSLLLAEGIVAAADGFARLAAQWQPVAAQGWNRGALTIGLPLMAGLALALWGGWETRDIINPVTVLAHPADVAALNWVDEHMPPDARFFINATPWQGSLYRGVDGGYWLLPLTGRFSVVPPVAFAWGEREEALRLLDWSRRAAQVTACDAEFWSLVKDAGLTAAYVHEGVGSLPAQILRGCQGSEILYEQDGVSIFALSP